MVAVRPTRLRDIADHLRRPLEGDGELLIRGLASLAGAGSNDLVFARSAQWSGALAASGAGAAVAPEDVPGGGCAVIRSPHPQLDFARAANWLTGEPHRKPGVDSGARVDASAQIHPSASVAVGATVGAGVVVGPHCALRPGCVLEPEVQLGADCTVFPQAVLCRGVHVGDRVILHTGAIVGDDGAGYTADEEGHPYKVPQLGTVVLEDDVEIGPGTVVQRGTLDATRIRRNAKIDGQCMIGHNCDIGEDVIIIAGTAIAGSVTVERGALILAQVGVNGHLTVGARAMIGARSGVLRDVPPGVRVWGAPAMAERAFHRSMAALLRLPELFRRVRRLEKGRPAGAQTPGATPAPAGAEGEKGEP